MCNTLCALISHCTIVVTQLFTIAVLFFSDACDPSCQNELIISGLVIACVAMIFIAAVVLILACYNKSEALLNFNCHNSFRRGETYVPLSGTVYFRLSLQTSN